MHESGDIFFQDTKHMSSFFERFKESNYIEPDVYEKYGVKRGLRNSDGTGVVAGVTQIADVIGYDIVDGKKVAVDGKLTYRGINVLDVIDGCIKDKRFGFEETAYLILFGNLPTEAQYNDFKELIASYTALPQNFTEDMILKAPSNNIMNKLSRSVLALYSYDDNPDDTSLPNLFRHSVELIARFPSIIAHAHAAKRHYYDNESLYLHRPQPNLSIAENFLYSIRPDNVFTDVEARILDLCLMLHAEHGGGNNSSFSCRVLASTGTDTYSAIAAAVGSLKGPLHGGANRKVMDMFNGVKKNVHDWKSDKELDEYLRRILRKEAGDGSGLIYGMGHAVYTVTDPRTVCLKSHARDLAERKGMVEELNLMESIERLAPGAFYEETKTDKVICANVDMYSGLIYEMLDIPLALHTPIFALSRVSGWCAHRIEEVASSRRIIRPAYKYISNQQEYVPMSERK